MLENIRRIERARPLTALLDCAEPPGAVPQSRLLQLRWLKQEVRHGLEDPLEGLHIGHLKNRIP
jgi:hypothetical protein